MFDKIFQGHDTSHALVFVTGITGLYRVAVGDAKLVYNVVYNTHCLKGEIFNVLFQKVADCDGEILIIKKNLDSAY